MLFILRWYTVCCQVRDKTGARIIFPNENDEDRDTIMIIGRKEQVEAAKKELNDIIKDLVSL